MDQEYDVIILGTGLTECILSGLLSVEGKRVLHMDRNDYYGGECASLSLEQVWKHCKKDGDVPSSLGKSRDYNIDLIPKFLMTQVKMLVYCNVTHYLEFLSVDGSYAVQGKKVYKVPATEKEAITSGLMGMFEKYRFKDLLEFCVCYDEDNIKTHKGIDLKKVSAREMLKKHKLDDSTVQFVGHSLALFRDDTYLDQPAVEFVTRVKLYADSLNQAVHSFDGRSPYLYPRYGLGDLPQAFARLASIYGGTYMLNKPFKGAEYDADGSVIGVKTVDDDGKDVTIKCKNVIADPTYFPELCNKTGSVVRAICILEKPIPSTDNSESCQVVIPQHTASRKSDIYISCVSSTHCVAPKGKFVVICSTDVESNTPEKEMDYAFNMLGPITQKFFIVSETFKPKNDHTKDHIYISDSYDATSHFETVCDNVLALYKRLTGKDLDLSKKRDAPGEGQ